MSKGSIGKTPNAYFHKTKTQREVRLYKGHVVSDLLGSVEKGTDIHVFTFGHFSLIDVITHLLGQIGPADVVLSAWTAAHSHLELIHEQLDALLIKSLRIVIDGSFMVRQPMYHKRMVELFGIENIRSIKTHAKYVILTNNEWHITIQTSMNMNENPRCENLIISEGKDLSDFMLGIVDEIFKEVDPEEDKQIHLRLDNMSSYQNYKQIDSDKLIRLKVPETRYVLND